MHDTNTPALYFDLFVITVLLYFATAVVIIMPLILPLFMFFASH